MKNKYKIIPIKEFPKTLKMYCKDSPKMIDVKVEFRPANKNKCKFCTLNIEEDKTIQVPYAYNIGEFGENYFQIICTPVFIDDMEEATTPLENFDKFLSYKRHKAKNEFFLDIGRACSIGEKHKKNDKCFGVGGLLSPLFNTSIKSDKTPLFNTNIKPNGDVIIKGQKYKVIILYSKAIMFHNIKIEKPSLVIIKETIKETIKKTEIFIGEFTVSLEKTND